MENGSIVTLIKVLNGAMKDYKTPAEQRARMNAYYYQHRQQILERQKQQREKEQQHKLKQYSNLIEMYESWNLELIQNLQTKKIPLWIRKGMILQIQQNNDRINQLEQ